MRRMRGSTLLARFGAAFVAIVAASCSTAKPLAGTSSLDGSTGSSAPPGVIPPGTVKGDSGSASADGGADAGNADGGDIDSGVDGPGEKWVRNQVKPSWLQIDAQYVYWVLEVAGQGAIVKMPLAGGTPSTLASDLIQPDSFRIDGTHAYWLAYGVQGGIHKVPLAGGTSTTLVSVAAPIPIRQIALGATDVFYTDAAAGVIKRVPKAGGSATVFASGLAGPSVLAVDASGVYVVESGDSGNVVRISLDGATSTKLATGQPDPQGIMLTATDVYWTNGGTFDVNAQVNVGAAIMKIPKVGGTPVEVVKVEGAKGMVADSTYLYFAAGDSIWRAPAAGGAKEAFAPLQKQPRYITADADYIYWANWGTGANSYTDGDVRRLPKH